MITPRISFKFKAMECTAMHSCANGFAPFDRARASGAPTEELVLQRARASRLCSHHHRDYHISIEAVCDAETK